MRSDEAKDRSIQEYLENACKIRYLVQFEAPTGDVNSTPTNTARAELHSMISYHHANTRGSRAAKLRIAHLCPENILSSTCHTSH